jgi:hypothetical protein
LWIWVLLIGGWYFVELGLCYWFGGVIGMMGLFGFVKSCLLFALIL